MWTGWGTRKDQAKVPGWCRFLTWQRLEQRQRCGRNRMVFFGQVNFEMLDGIQEQLLSRTGVLGRGQNDKNLVASKMEMKFKVLGTNGNSLGRARRKEHSSHAARDDASVLDGCMLADVPRIAMELTASCRLARHPRCRRRAAQRPAHGLAARKASAPRPRAPAPRRRPHDARALHAFPGTALPQAARAVAPRPEDTCGFQGGERGLRQNRLWRVREGWCSQEEDSGQPSPELPRD